MGGGVLMFVYPIDYQAAKDEWSNLLSSLETRGYSVSQVSTPIVDSLAIDQTTIHAKTSPTRRLVFSIGLHGIEGYVGHAAVRTFFDHLFPHLEDDVEVVVFHPLNPYGMRHFRRTNENNVDLNRNFSQHGYQTNNPGYAGAKFFFEPKRYRSVFHANLSFYTNVLRLVLTRGVAAMKEATLKGQNSHARGLYYGGVELEASSRCVMDSLPRLLQDSSQVVWIDLHTGYGPRDQMSIVNSKYEIETTKRMRETFTYPLILGLNKDDFYDIDGDMIERIYQVHQELGQPSRLYATCFEFGTLGASLLRSIESLKAMILEHGAHFVSQPPKVAQYAGRLIREQFLPADEGWRHKAELDFLKATEEILRDQQMIG
jgi:hypothetical protein